MPEPISFRPTDDLEDAIEREIESIREATDVELDNLTSQVIRDRLRQAYGLKNEGSGSRPEPGAA